MRLLGMRLLGEADCALHFIFLRYPTTCTTLTLLVNWLLLLRVRVLVNCIVKQQLSCKVNVALGLHQSLRGKVLVEAHAHQLREVVGPNLLVALLTHINVFFS